MHADLQAQAPRGVTHGPVPADPTGVPAAISPHCGSLNPLYWYAASSLPLWPTAPSLCLLRAGTQSRALSGWHAISRRAGRRRRYYRALKSIGELFPGPSKTTRAYLHPEEKVVEALSACGFKLAPPPSAVALCAGCG